MAKKINNNKEIKTPEITDSSSNPKKSVPKSVQTKNSVPNRSKSTPKNIVDRDKNIPAQKDIKVKPKPILDILTIKLKKKKLLPVLKKKEDYYQNFYSKFIRHFKNDLFFSEFAEIIIAVSGGVDSIVLLDILANLTTELRIKNIYVAHFNHKLRGQTSNDDEMFVRDVAESYGLPYYFSTGNVRQHSEQAGLSIEHSARILRYKFFERTAKTVKASYMATAHTADDTIETFFLNLFRGAGLTGLSGIPTQRNILKHVSMIRPLLCFRKSEIIEYAQKRNLKWREDESNSLLYYTRNKIRHDLLPKLESEYSPALVDIISRTQRLLHGADSYITREVNNLLNSVIKSRTPNRFALSVPILETFEEFIQGEIVQAALSTIFQMQNISLSAIDRVLSLINSSTGSVCEINKKYFALRDRTQIIFAKKQKSFNINMPIEKIGTYDLGTHRLILKEVSQKEVQYTQNATVEYFDFDLLPVRLIIRSKENGDVFHPIGMEGTIKLSDFLTNIKIPLIDKQEIPLLTTKSEIVWVCGKRISNKFKVTSETKRFLKAEFLTNEKQSHEKEKLQNKG